MFVAEESIHLEPSVSQLCALNLPFFMNNWIHCKTCLHENTFRIQKYLYTKYLLWFPDSKPPNQNRMFLFWIHLPVCKRHNKAGTKTSQIHHKSRKISPSVNIALVATLVLNDFILCSLQYQWLKLTADDVKEQIYKLAKKGLTPSQIGQYKTSQFIL